MGECSNPVPLLRTTDFRGQPTSGSQTNSSTGRNLKPTPPQGDKEATFPLGHSRQTVPERARTSSRSPSTGGTALGSQAGQVSRPPVLASASFQTDVVERSGKGEPRLTEGSKSPFTERR